MKNLSTSVGRASNARAGRCRFDRVSAAARCSIERLEARTLLSASLESVAPLIQFPQGAAPSAVTLDASGNLFGTTEAGGADGDGTVFEIGKGSRAITTVAAFDGTDGSSPQAAVTFDSHGDLFGTTFFGGASNDGTVFEIAKPALSLSNGGSRAITTLASFGADDPNSVAPVTFDSHGNLFGTTSQNGSRNGTVFEIAKGSSVITTLASLNDLPEGALTFDSGGNLFGTTAEGGANGGGSVFEIAKPALSLSNGGSQTLTTVASFSGSLTATLGFQPEAGVTFDSGGNLFGTTTIGGSAIGDGTVFEIAKGTSTITTVASFDGPNGNDPQAAVTFDSRGNLFGTTMLGGTGGGTYGAGTVFEIAKGSTTLTTVASFGAPTGNGSSPNPTAVVFDSKGNLFGTATGGGPIGQGSVFEIAKGTRTLATVASFNVNNPANPTGAVTFDSHGDLFGTSEYGGASDLGTIYEIAKGSRALTTVASFTNGYELPDPNGVTFDAAGNLFGTTLGGGANTNGTVFELAKGSSTITTVASFDGTDGFYPEASVTFDASGNLFGTTHYGGTDTPNQGTVFEIAKGSQTITTVASFDGANGGNPDDAVTFDSHGDLFGTTSSGGAGGDGTIFEIAKGSKTLTTLVNFNGTNGGSPEGAITFDSGGDLLGTASQGGADMDGLVFEIAKAALSLSSPTLTTVASFDGKDGSSPASAVTFDSRGDLFGTASGGGAGALGTVFEIAAKTRTITSVASFDGTDGQNPNSALAFDSSGDLFGTSESGGAAYAGAIFEVMFPAAVTGTVFHDANGDGTQDDGETGLAGVQVYVDLGDHGHFVAGDPTTTTNAAGGYTLSGLAAGSYIVRQTLPPGDIQTFPRSGLGDHLTVSAGQTLSGQNFGDEG